MLLEIVTQADDALCLAFQRLVPQLTNSNPPPSLDALRALVQDPASALVVATAEAGEIVGALTLIVYRVPTGIRSIIEDVVVDSDSRGRGVGAKLIGFAIELAREKGAGSVSLTSNPGRRAANHLYLRMGFARRETNCYQLKL